MNFKRELFIKDLYNLNEIYGKFRSLCFSSVKDFFKFFEKGYIKESQEYIIDINTEEEALSICYAYDQILQEKKVRLSFVPKDKYIVSALLKISEEVKTIKNTTMILDYELASYLVDEMKEPYYCFENNIRLSSTYSANDFFAIYKRDMALLLRAFYHRMSYDLHFDYASFEEAPLKVLHSLRFVCNQLNLWDREKLETDMYCCDDNSERKQGHRRIPLIRYRNALVGFLDEEGQIFIDKERTCCYLRDPLEKKNQYEISKIRSLIDIGFFVKNLNGNLIDLYQNVLIMKDIYSVPYTTLMINRWLNGEEIN